MTCTLLINSQSSGLRLRRAEHWWTRLVGFWPAPAHHRTDVIEFAGCRAIHTFAMRAALDIVFVDRHGRTLRVLHRLAPWRVKFDRQASAVFEFPAGVARQLRIETGTELMSVVQPQESTRNNNRATRTRLRGSATLEFVLAATLVLLPLVTGILEFAQLAVSRQILAQAVVDTARSTAIRTMDARAAHRASAVTDRDSASTSESLAIRMSLARGMLPLLGGGELAVDRLAEVTIEIMRPDRLQFSLERDVLETADVSIDRLEVTYCRELFFAPASHFLPGLMRLWTTVPFDLICLETGRVPLRVFAPATRSKYP